MKRDKVYRCISSLVGSVVRAIHRVTEEVRQVVSVGTTCDLQAADTCGRKSSTDGVCSVVIQLEELLLRSVPIWSYQYGSSGRHGMK